MTAVLISLTEHSEELFIKYKGVSEDLCEVGYLSKSQIENNPKLAIECRAVYSCISRALTIGSKYLHEVDRYICICGQEMDDIKASVRQGTYIICTSSLHVHVFQA